MKQNREKCGARGKLSKLFLDRGLGKDGNRGENPHILNLGRFACFFFNGGVESVASFFTATWFSPLMITIAQNSIRVTPKPERPARKKERAWEVS